MEDMDQKDWWVVEVESSLKDNIRPDESPDGQDEAASGLIHKVPESLLREDTEVFYHPQVLFLGPYHFKGKERPPVQMESLKSEVARYVHLKITDGLESRNEPEIEERKKKADKILEEKKEKERYVKNESSLKWGKKSFKKDEENKKKKGYVKKEGGLKSVMESFMEKEERIKKKYAIEFEFTGEVCAWMIARDACFVIQVLERFGDIVEDEDARKSVSASIDSILSRKRCHPLLTEIVKDVLKMENQLPFWTLTEIRPDIKNWFESALENLSLIKVADAVKDRQYNPKEKSESHILQLLHDYIVDSQQNSASGINLDCFTALLCTCFCVFASCFNLKWPDYLSTPCNCIWQCIKWLLKALVFGIILLVLSPVVLIMLIINAIGNHKSSIWWKIRKIRKILNHDVPTVEELKSVGVKFKKLKGGKKGISHIEFNKGNSTLYLPRFEVDNSSEVILRNLIALEICSQEKQKPITRYAILMNNLINTGGDVAILRQEDIITSKLGSDEDTAKLWNSMVTSTEVPSFQPIDDAVSSIDEYRQKWWKVLWAQFVMTHCSKPWLFLSLLAGVILLVLTIVQVVCLFESCQIK